MFRFFCNPVQLYYSPRSVEETDVMRGVYKGFPGHMPTKLVHSARFYNPV